MKQKIEEILVWSEQYTKTDMNYLVKGSFWLNIGQTVSIITGFLLSIAFARHLSQETLGTYKYILSLIGIIGSLSLSGLGSAITRAVAKGAEGEFIKGFILNLRWSVLITIGALALAIYYFINGNNVLAIGLLIGGVCSPLLDSTELYGCLLSGRKDFKTASLYRICRSLYTFFGLIIAIFITNNPLILISVYFFVQTSSAAFLFYHVYKVKKPNTIEDPDTHRLGKHVSVMNLLSVFADKIDDVLVFHYLGPIQLAVYNYAVAIPENLSGFIKQIGGLATPKFVNQDKDIVRKSIFSKSLVLFLTTLPIVILYIIFVPYIFDLIFVQYSASVTYSQVFAITILISGVLPIAFMDAHTAIKQKYQLSVSSNIFKLIVMIAGVYYFGIWGAVFGKIISKLFGLILSWFLIYKV